MMGEISITFREYLLPVPVHKSFVIKDGGLITDIMELIKAIKCISGELFLYHVTPYKNDFAAWIYHVIGDKILAELIGQVKDRDEIVRLIEIRFFQLMEAEGLPYDEMLQIIRFCITMNLAKGGEIKKEKIETLQVQIVSSSSGNLSVAEEKPVHLSEDIPYENEEYDQAEPSEKQNMETLMKMDIPGIDEILFDDGRENKEKRDEYAKIQPTKAEAAASGKRNVLAESENVFLPMDIPSIVDLEISDVPPIIEPESIINENHGNKK
jgi:hypothetical protein